MGDTKDTLAAKLDSYELGPVDNVHDLEVNGPEGSKSRVKKEQESLVHPTVNGYFETQAYGLAEAEAGPLLLEGETLNTGGATIAEYQAGYNMYAVPLRQSVRAMGRVKDLSEAGSPMTVTQLKANPKLNSRFKQLSLTANQDAVAQSGFNDWQQAQSHLELESAGFAAAQQQLAAAQQNWHRVQMAIQQRKAEAEKDSSSSELREINEAADTCAEIVKVSAEAWAGASEVGEALESSRGITGAEELGADNGTMAAVAKQPQKDAVDDNAPGDARSRVNKATQAGQDAVASAGDANKILSHVRSMATASKVGLDLSLEDVFVVAMGKHGKKLDLENKINKLSAIIGNLKWNEVTADIEEGRTRLKGFKMEVSVRNSAVQTERNLARSGVQTFNQGIKGGDDEVLGQMAMMMVEAQQERAMFGKVAASDYQSFVAANWHRALNWINDPHNVGELDHKGELADARRIANNIQAVGDARDYLNKNLPTWEKDANAWRSFVEQETQKPLIAQDAGLKDKT